MDIFRIFLFIKWKLFQILHGYKLKLKISSQKEISNLSSVDIHRQTRDKASSELERKVEQAWRSK